MRVEWLHYILLRQVGRAGVKEAHHPKCPIGHIAYLNFRR